jgi:hypothetical protein
MPARLQLTALPGYLEARSGYTSKVVEIMGREYGRETVIIGTVADVRVEIAAFGQRVRAKNPDVSFAILAGFAKGDRKPRGFDAAKSGGLGEDEFLIVRERPAA